ncbi:hypothetical protein HanIR_Chr10g0484941 [Helianthus annuus]|nr:hypothetical protein HanIR_Chr10g0484941 [Helianthus annuus]
MMYTVYGWMERDSLFPYLVQKKKKTLIPNISQLSQLLQPTSSRSTAPRQSGIHRSTAPPHRHQDPPLSACIHRRPSTTHSTPAVQSKHKYFQLKLVRFAHCSVRSAHCSFRFTHCLV